MARHDCIVNDVFCGTFELCDFCKDEIKHRREVELARARNDGIRQAKEARSEAFDTLGRTAVEHPVGAAVGLGIAAAIFGITAAVKNKKK